MRTNEKEFISFYLIFLILLSFTTSLIMVLVASLLLYLLLIKIAGLKERSQVFEIITFTTFFSLWLNSLIHKNALFGIGYSLIWRNIPNAILSNYFTAFNILEGVFKIGLLPLVFGLFIIYRQIFKQKNKDIYLVISFSLASLLLLWLKLIDISIGLSLLGISLIILFGIFVDAMLEYFEKTKMAKYRYIFMVSTILFIVLTSIIPTLIYANNSLKDVPNKALIDSMQWLRDNTDENAVVLGTLDEGFIISSIAKRKNVFDSNFLGVNNPDQYIEDVNKIYVAQYLTDAIGLLDKYGVDYIVVSENARKEYSIEQLPSYDKNCYDVVYDSDVKILKIKCHLGDD
jgi:hypothetical protein